MDPQPTPLSAAAARLNRLAIVLGIDPEEGEGPRRALRMRALVAAAMAVPLYLVFTLGNLLVYPSFSMAAVSAASAALAGLALLTLRIRSDPSMAGHWLIAALTVQVFGDMMVNGGMQSPSAPLALMIVPAAIAVCGLRAFWPWVFVALSSLVSICASDATDLLPASPMPPQWQSIGRLLALGVGMGVCATLVIVYEKQAMIAIARLRAERARFRHDALHDPLTGLPNRSYLLAHSEVVLAEAGQNGGSCALFYFDIDRFKQINDRHGHALGDALLTEFGARLSSRLRDGELAARLAGDEFVVIAVTPDDGQGVAELTRRLRTITRDTFDLATHRLDVEMSVGHACFPADADTLERLLQIADARMYEDKLGRAGSTAHQAGERSGPDRNKARSLSLVK
ncbi:MAG: diguanylate cyclase [Burkholderiaceae bacterium]